MTVEGERLTVLHRAAERISASLVELELDSSRKLLEASMLEGESAARWAMASDAMTELWRQRGLLEELLARADEAERCKHGEELRKLLTGPSIELSSADVPLAERTLLGTVRSVERCSADDLIVAMSTTFDEVKAVLTAFSAAWDWLLPGMETARRLMSECTQRADGLGDTRRLELETVGQRVRQLGAAVMSDPLSLTRNEVDAAIGALRSICDDLEEIGALRERFDVLILEARELLERLSAAEREAQVAHEESARKIAYPPVPPVPSVPPGLGAELTAIVEMGERGAWSDAHRELGDWNARTRALLDDVVKSREANRAPVVARDQFRALLEAYQVKAKRLGLLEEAEMADLWARAHDALYTAPTDLAIAAQLVRRYQELLTGLRPPGERTS